LSTSYFLEETAEKEEEEGGPLRFIKPVLPPGTKLTGIIGSEDNKVAIILMNDETFIANLYDILLDRYIVKEIKKDEVIIDYNGYFFSVKIGGEDLSDGL
jgi:type II secretory pathway component PulC